MCSSVYYFIVTKSKSSLKIQMTIRIYVLGICTTKSVNTSITLYKNYIIQKQSSLTLLHKSSYWFQTKQHKTIKKQEENTEVNTWSCFAQYVYFRFGIIYLSYYSLAHQRPVNSIFMSPVVPQLTHK